MKTCPKCGCTTDNDNANYCKKCGIDLRILIADTTEAPICLENLDEEYLYMSQHKIGSMVRNRMTFSRSISTVLKKYANGKERASRAEFWWWQLFVFVVSFCTGFLDGLFGFEIGISGILSLGLLLPNICVAIRRCHDSNHSGWWIICPVVNIVMMFLPSDPNANEYGEPEISSAEKEVY